MHIPSAALCRITKSCVCSSWTSNNCSHNSNLFSALFFTCWRPSNSEWGIIHPASPTCSMDGPIPKVVQVPWGPGTGTTPTKMVYVAGICPSTLSKGCLLELLFRRMLPVVVMVTVRRAVSWLGFSWGGRREDSGLYEASCIWKWL